MFELVKSVFKIFFPNIKSNGYTDYPLPCWG
jgi:hypothetical protein